MSIDTSGHGEVLLQDPHNAYAVRFIEVFAQRFGLRSVCLYTDADAMRTLCWQFPQLRGPHVSASYLVSAGELEEAGRAIGRRHRIVGVVPHVEQVVAEADRLATVLGLDWAQPDIRWRFRDKFALKDYLRSASGGPRVNATARVQSLGDVRRNLASGCFPEYVLKPNDGAGNAHIGFFKEGDDERELDKYLSQTSGAPLLMEEFIGGEEYYVDGQVDAAGTVTIVGVYQYLRYEINGRRNVLSGTRSLRSTSPEFESIANYASHVMVTTGLRRSPFHLEVKLDHRGPCLIEVAARFVGKGGVDVDDDMHGDLSVYDLAAHYLISSDDYGDTGVDWDRADERVRGQVFGASTVEGRVNAIRGRSEVEAHSGFVRWETPPRIGDRVEPTVDVNQHPWVATIVGGNDQEFDEVREYLHRTVNLSCDESGVRGTARMLAAKGPGLGRSIRRRLTPTPRLSPLDGPTVETAH